jgi:hypothetical protein
METEVVEYVIVDKAKLSVADIQRDALAAWADVRTAGTTANANAKAAGIDVESLPASLEDVVRIKAGGAGVGSIDLVIAGVLAKIALDFWRHVLLPHIRETFGDNAIKAKKAEAKKSAKTAAQAPRKR